jgi:L-galactose dehydrogenase
MQYRKLGKTGVAVSVMGFGAGPLGGDHGPVEPDDATRAVHYAIDQGINIFDVSPYYGRTVAEDRLGKALAGKRDKVFLATKCGRYDHRKFDFSAQRVKASIDESLKRLRTDHVDLLQAHDIEFGDREQIINETIPAMREIQESGKARYVGITGLPLKILRDVANRVAIQAILTYCRYNLMVTDMDEILTPFVRQRGIGLINAAPLHMGILTEAGPPSWHPAPAEIKEAGQKVARLCRKRAVNVVEIALRFCLDHPYVSTTLVGMSSTAQVKRNLNALNFRIDRELMQEIQETIAPVKNQVWPSGRPENDD